MTTVRQPGYAPTNKLTAAIVGGALFEFAEPVIAKGIALAGGMIGVNWTLGPNFGTVVMFLTMFLAGYIVKDRPNVR